MRIVELKFARYSPPQGTPYREMVVGALGRQWVIHCTRVPDDVPERRESAASLARRHMAMSYLIAAAAMSVLLVVFYACWPSLVPVLFPGLGSAL